MIRIALELAAVGDDAVVDLGMRAVIGRDLVAHAGIDRQIRAAKQAVADLRIEQRQIVAEELGRAFVEERHTLKDVRLDFHARLGEAVHHEIALEMIAVMRHGVGRLADQQLAADDEDAH